MTTKKNLLPIMITRNKSYLLLFLIFLVGFQPLIYSQNKDGYGWRLVKAQKGIKVYIRKHKSSSLKEVLAIMETKTSLNAIVALLKNTQNHKNWMYANKESYVLKSPSNFEWILYSKSEAPWPILDRDLVSHARMYQSSDNCTIKIKAHAIPDYMTYKKGLVRICEMDSEWTFTPKYDGFIEIRFKIRVNLGGNLPVWLTNLAVDKGPYSTLSKMKSALAKNKYRHAKLPYIKENCSMAKQ